MKDSILFRSDHFEEDAWCRKTELNSEYFGVQEENALFRFTESRPERRENLEMFKETMISVVGHAEVNVSANSQLNLHIQ